MRCRNATKCNIIVETQQRHNISLHWRNTKRFQRRKQNKIFSPVCPSLSRFSQHLPPFLLLSHLPCVFVCFRLFHFQQRCITIIIYSNITININSNLLFATNIHIQLIYSKGLLARFYSGIDYTWELKTWSKHRTKWECQDKI